MNLANDFELESKFYISGPFKQMVMGINEHNSGSLPLGQRGRERLRTSGRK